MHTIHEISVFTRSADLNKLDSEDRITTFLSAIVQAATIFSHFEMDELKKQDSDPSCRIQTNLSEQLKRFKQLLSAVKHGQKEIIQSLLEAGVPVNCHPLWLKIETPLHLSVRYGDASIVAELLNRGASVNAQYLHDTPVLLAAKLEKYEIADLLLLAQGLKNYTDRNGMTHFHVACMRNQVEVAKILLQCEGDVNVVVNSKSDCWPGFTALHFAVQFQNIETVEFLLSVGSDITIKDVRQLTPLHLAHNLRNVQIVDAILLHHVGIVSNPVDSNGLSHFHIACTRNKPNVVEHFIEVGADLRDPITKKYYFHQKIAMDLAIQHKCIDVLSILSHYWARQFAEYAEEYNRIPNAYPADNLEIAELFMTKSILTKRSRKFQLNFLHFFSLDRTECIKECFSRTFSPIHLPITPTGCTPLHSAIECKNQKVSEFLIGIGADYRIQDIRGKSPLHLGFEHNMTELVDSMLKDQRHPPQNIVDNNGLSHLHIACARNNANTAESLLKLGADVNDAVNSNSVFWPGFGPLHFAAKFGSVDVAKVLLKHGANYSATDASNLSPFDIAFMEANATRNRSAINFMKLILKLHSQCENKNFNDRGVSLLHLAAIVDSKNVGSSNGEMTQLLYIFAADVNKPIHQMGTDWDGNTVLHFAVQQAEARGHVNSLLKVGANVVAQNARGDTPMHVMHMMLSPIISNFIFASQDFRFLQLNHIGSTGLSIFHKACDLGNLDLMKCFIEHGVDLNCPSLSLGLGNDDQAPLHLVLRRSYKRIESVKLLLEYGADPNVRDFQGDTPLHHMTRLHHLHAHPEIIEILVSHGADIDALNAQLETPLVSLFLKLGNHVDYCGDFIRRIEFFLDNGANIDLADKRGVTALYAASGWTRLNNLRNSRGFNDAMKIIDMLLRHIIKQDCIGFKVTNNANKKKLYMYLRDKFRDDLTFVEGAFIEKCYNELELMKLIRTDTYTTLHDILLKSPNKLASTSQNDTFQNIVNSNDFFEKYPIYGAMLKSRLIQGQVRWRLLKGSMENFNSLLGITLPRICSDNILQFLSNQDLRHIITHGVNSR